MQDYSKRAWVEINLDNIRHNFDVVKKTVNKNTKILCVLKADAYGHGAPFLCKEFEKLGADWFGVSNIDEAIQLRRSGADLPILIFGYTPPELAKKLVNYNITQSLFSKNYAHKLINICKENNIKIKSHLKIDTGMNRIGFLAQNNDDINNSVQDILEINNYSEIDIQGIFTHFSVSDNISDNYTQEQFKKFINLVNILETNNMSFDIKHCCNSGAVINYPKMHLDMVRAGIILYGLTPSENLNQKINLKPVMCLKSIISQIKTIPENISIGYGRGYITDKKIRLATVPIGYADGYSCSFSNKAYMLVCGKKAKIVGKVCMDQLMIDVSDIPEAGENCEVVLFGDNNSLLTIDNLVNIGSNLTVNYELMCLIGKRVPRYYYKNNKLIGKHSYL